MDESAGHRRRGLAASNGHHLSVGPWIIVPILIVVAIIATPIYIARDRRKRRANDGTK